MKIRCPHCGQKYEVEDDLSGESVECQVCKKNFMISLTDAELIQRQKERIVELESMISFQEQEISMLKQALAETQKELSQAKINISALEDDLGIAGSDSEDCGEEILRDFSSTKHSFDFKARNSQIGNTDKDGETNMSFCDSAKAIGDINFSGCSFCITGKFTYASRGELEKTIENLGGTILERVTEDLNFLIVGKAASAGWGYGNFGSKIDRALKIKGHNPMGLMIVSEDVFFNQLKRAATDAAKGE